MGSGKTTVAAEVSRLTGMLCFDTDRMVENATDMTISEIFERFGEETFRRFEHDAICDMMRNERFIASLGGGAVLFERNLSAIRTAGGTIIWLDVPLPVINQRLALDTQRPLLDGDLDKRLALFQARLPFYQAAADLRIDGNTEPLELAKYLIHQFCL